MAGDRWAPRQRQAWIAETIQIFGFIRRRYIQRKFEVSVPQASMDLQTFIANNPGVLEYDKTLKCYRAVRWKDEEPVKA